MKNAFWTLVITIAAGCLIAACGDVRTNSWSGYQRIPSEGWLFGEAVDFTPVHPDSVCRGRMVVALRHDSSYPYTGVRLEIAASDNGVQRRDTVDVQLADSYGQWLGRGIGISFQITDTLPPLTHVSGTEVSVRHLMRADTLAGISQVGVFFVPY